MKLSFIQRPKLSKTIQFGTDADIYIWSKFILTIICSIVDIQYDNDIDEYDIECSFDDQNI